MSNKSLESQEDIPYTSDKTPIYRSACWFHHRFLRGKFLTKPLHILRFRLIITGWGYLPLLNLNNMPIADRLKLIGRFLKIDWNVMHAHRPMEITIICRTISEHGQAGKDEIFIEAGCWKGGSSAKFSIICKIFGYKLHIYDSFEGIEEMSPDQIDGATDYSGMFSETKELVEYNLRTYGEASVCSLHKGWFIKTLASKPVRKPIMVVYIDCDFPKGTEEVLKGTLLSLLPDGVIFSQDYFIKPVRRLLHNPETWQRFGRAMPDIRYEFHHLASIRFEKSVDQ